MRTTAEVGEQHITGVSRNVLSAVVERLSSSLANDVDRWLHRRVQSRRSERPDGLFDLIPSSDDLRQLVEEVADLTEFEAIIDHIGNWLRTRLDEQLSAARSVFRTEFESVLRDSIVNQRDAMLTDSTYRRGDIRQVATALEMALSRRTADLVHWFKGVTNGDRLPLTFGEVKRAADGLFETAISKKEFRATLIDCECARRKIAPEKVRLCFDLLSEVFTNSLKHSTGKTAKVRIRPFSSNGLSGFLFSNLALLSRRDVKCIQGRRYESSTEAIFREGNSGLVKIASLAATLIERDCELFAHTRGHSFHLAVPIWAKD